MNTPTMPRVRPPRFGGGWRIHKEEPTHFMVSKEGGSPFKVAKRGLSAPLIKSIQGFAKGGSVPHYDDGTVASGGDPTMSLDQYLAGYTASPLDPEATIAPGADAVAPPDAVSPAGIQKAADIAAALPVTWPTGVAIRAADAVLPAAIGASQVAGLVPSGEPLHFDTSKTGRFTPRATQPPDQVVQPAPAVDSKAELDAVTAGLPKAPSGGVGAASERGINEQIAARKATGEIAAGNAELLLDASAIRQKADAAANEVYAKSVVQNDRDIKALRDNMKDIDPDRWQNSGGTTRKVLSTIASALGAFGASLGHSPNFAQEQINNEINRDINAQQANLGKQRSELSFLLSHGRSIADARQLLLAKNQQEYADRAHDIALQSTDPDQQAAGIKLAGQLHADADQNKQGIALKNKELAINQYRAQVEGKMLPEQVLNARRANEIGAMQLQDAREQRDAVKSVFGPPGAAATTSPSGQAAPDQSSAASGIRIDPRVIPKLPPHIQEALVSLPDGTYAMLRDPKDKKGKQLVEETQRSASDLKEKMDRYEALRVKHPHGIFDTTDPGDYATAEALHADILAEMAKLHEYKRLTDADLKIYQQQVPDLRNKYFRDDAHAAKMHELGREVDDKVWNVNQTYLNLPRRKIPGAQ